MRFSHFVAAGFVALTLSTAPGSTQSNAPPGGPQPPAVSPLGGGGSNLGSSQMFAVVNADGSIARGKGEGAVARTSLGVYRIGFLRNLMQCGYVASVGGTSTELATGIANVTRLVGQSGVLIVRTFSLTGAAADRPFHIYIDC
jgi:hypothetical protein